MRFGETARFLIIFLLPLLLLAFLTFSVPSSSYTVTNLNLLLDFRNDSLYVVETLNYQINEPGFRELYRSYTMDGALANMQVHASQCPAGAYFYSQKSGNNLELICRKDTYYSPGPYSIQFTYSIPSPYYCESDRCVLHWKVLDSFSAPIEKINVVVQGKISQWLSTPMPDKVSAGQYSLPGIYPGGLLEFFVATPRDGKLGGAVSGLDGHLQSYRRQAVLQTFMLKNGGAVVALLALVEFGAVLWIFLKVSKEHPTPEVPEVLHYKPKGRKPHEMAFLFGDRPGTKINPRAIDATLLDLARRGFLKIGKNRIDVLKKAGGLDSTEMRLLDFYSEHGDIASFKKQIKSMSSWQLSKLSREMDAFVRPTKELKIKFKTIYDEKGSSLVWAIIVVSFLSGLLLSNCFSISYPKFTFFAGVQIMLAVLKLIFDNYVFGRYSLEGVREKRKWDAFRNLLCSTAQMKKYEPEDLSMWGDWLVYATAFGCAEKVLKRMKFKNIRLPYVPDYGMDLYMYSVLRSTAYSQLAAKTGRAVGGFSGGVGGGFGGGGGGAR